MSDESVELSSPIQYIKGVGPHLAKALAKKGIETLEDALYFIPRDYEDRRHITLIKNLLPGTTAIVLGQVVSNRVIRQGRQNRFEAVLTDGTGDLHLVWFHAYPSLKSEFEKGQSFVICGEVKYFGGFPQVSHPDYEKVTLKPGEKPAATLQFGRVVPIYSETEGLHQKTIRKIMGEVLKLTLKKLDEPLPASLRAKLSLPGLRESFVGLHFPTVPPKENELTPALQRIIFEEFFVLQLGLCLKRQRLAAETAPVLSDSRGWVEKFVAGLPFAFTGDQKKTLEQIIKDLGKPSATTRLVQGDVGSGKTVVALAAAVAASSAGYQTAIMAPTEILAGQHFKLASAWFAPLGIKVALVVSQNSGKREVQEEVASGAASVVIGTHALFQEGVKFKQLGLVIVDEQHRFGVEQRAELVRKGTASPPHLILMTATPIPRTLALTLYGDLDMSLIREKPAGRQPIKTIIIREQDRPKLYQKIRERVKRGEQVYVIYPLVEASEKLDLKSATEMHQRLSKEIFPEFAVALLHGRMKGEEKDRILIDFKAAKYQILISTTVIEVGIDVPNATLMVIEHPERLGLSQLHQLRGRVGRGKLESECLLVADKFVTPRLRVMTQTEDGFVIAEEDLKIRGPGEFLGTRQSGMPGFRAGHILRDADLLVRAREEAIKLLEEDPKLSSPENAGIRAMVESRWKEKIERLRGG